MKYHTKIWLFLVCFSGAFFVGKGVFAATYQCECFSDTGRTQIMGQAFDYNQDLSSNKADGCETTCFKKGAKGFQSYVVAANGTKRKNMNNGETDLSTTNSALHETLLAKGAMAIGEAADKVGEVASNVFLSAIKSTLEAVRNMFMLLTVVAGVVFNLAINPVLFNATLNHDQVRIVWTMVRDFLNMFFILVLLFSAFATIFQVGKYHIKKIWLWVVLMALLVNFSFPIARLFVDISNVMMYSFVNEIFPTMPKGGLLAQIGTASEISQVLLPFGGSSETDFTNLIATTIFVFILMTVFLYAAGMMLVRMVVLTMLVMFSPIGFVGYIFPGTEKYAKQWWDALINYCFFGPIMIFGIAVAIKLMRVAGEVNTAAVRSVASANADGAMVTWIANAVQYLIPIMILSYTISVAKKFNIAFSSGVLEYASKPKGWLKSLGGMGWRATGVPGGFKQAKDYYAKRGVRNPLTGNRMLGSDQTAQSSANWAQAMGVRGAATDELMKQIDSTAKDMRFDDLSDDMVRAKLKGGRLERAAAYEELAKRGKIGADELGKALEDYGGKDSAYAKRVMKATKEKRPDLAWQHVTDTKDREKMIQGFDAKNLNAEILANEEFMKAYVGGGKMDKKVIDGLTDTERTQYTATLKKIVDKVDSSGNFVNVDPDDKGSVGVHLQNLALDGKMHSSIFHKGDPIKDQMRKKLWGKLNKDIATGFKDKAMLSLYGDEIVTNVDPGKFREVLLAVPDDANKKILIDEVNRIAADPANAGNRRAVSLQGIIRKDEYLRRL